MAIYREPGRNQHLNTLFRLQIVAGQYTEAVSSHWSLTELRRAIEPSSALPLMPFTMLAKPG
jgi:hypothetical protein